MKFFMIINEDLYSKNQDTPEMLINICQIVNFHLYDDYVTIFFVDDYQIDVTWDCFNSIMAFIKSAI